MSLNLLESVQDDVDFFITWEVDDGSLRRRFHVDFFISFVFFKLMLDDANWC